MGRFKDAASSKVREATRLSLHQLGRWAVAHIKFKISEPVEYIGSEVIRSEPGEPPRMEFKDLRKSIKYRVESSPILTIANLVVYTAYRVAIFLEYGTHKMEPRPFWEPSRKEIGRLGAQLKRMVAGRLRRGSGPEPTAEND